MTVLVLDNVLQPDFRSEVESYLKQPTWQFGWKSHSKSDVYSFWHKHFAGNIRSDHGSERGTGHQYDCSRELAENAPLLERVWRYLQETALQNHILQRCYANGQPYGSEGTVHTDSVDAKSFTGVYYPHETWDPNWGGETIIFNNECDEIVSATYPKPNRLLIFPGNVPHVARGVSRTCPTLRITLMFKFEVSTA